MAQEEKIDDRVSVAQCKRAIDSLHAHVSKFMAKKAETELLPATEPWFWLTIGLKQQPKENGLKVFRIPVAHPIVDPRKESICLFTKDPQRTYKDMIADNDIKFIHKVVGLEKLKGKHKAFENRRVLLKEHGLFLADDRILPLLPKLLGSKFFQAKKQPIPVNLSRKKVKEELEQAINSTYMPNVRGTSISIKVGRFSQKPAHVLANIKTALPAIAAKINGGWSNIQSLGIKTNDSVNLPVWSCSLDDEENGRWAGLTAEDEDEDEDMDSDDIDVAEDVEMDGDDEKSDSPAAGQSSKKGKKRVADSDEVDEEVEKPKKKSKSSDGAIPTSKKSISTPAKKPLSSDDTISALPESLSKPKTKKALAPGAPTPANTPAATKKAVVAVPTATQSQKSSTKQKSTVEPVIPAVDAASENPTPKKKKGKKAAAEGIVEPAPVIAPTPVVDPAGKKGKGKKAAAAAEGVVEPAPTPVVDSVSVKKSKKARTSEAAATVSAPSADAGSASSPKKSAAAEAKDSTSTEVPKKKKKQSVAADEAGVGEILSAAAAALVSESAEKSSSKKEKKRKSDAAAEVLVDETDEAPKQKKKKEKKSNEAVVEEQSAAAAETEVKKGKKEKKAKKSVDAADEAMAIDDTPGVEAPSAKAPETKKKSKKTKVAEQAPALSKEELKQKRSDAPGEKKKGKVVKAKGGKSAKDALLGKKVLS